MSLKSRKIYCNSYTQEWCCEERNGRNVIIGRFKIKSCLIVNPQPDDTYDALYCILEDENGQHPVVIPYKELKKWDILEYLLFFKRNPDCPDKYIIDLLGN